jgi:transposase-like protein
MSLPARLASVVLSRPCPYCGHVLDKKGSWFQHISHYRCESCQKQVEMTYEAKVELFEKYSRQKQIRAPCDSN